MLGRGWSVRNGRGLLLSTGSLDSLAGFFLYECYFTAAFVDLGFLSCHFRRNQSERLSDRQNPDSSFYVILFDHPLGAFVQFPA